MINLHLHVPIASFLVTLSPMYRFTENPGKRPQTVWGSGGIIYDNVDDDDDDNDDVDDDGDELLLLLLFLLLL